VLALVNPGNLLPLLRATLESSGFFGARFREAAGRALLLTRFHAPEVVEQICSSAQPAGGLERKIATALFYGISAETQDLGRESTPADIAAAQFLYPYTNKRRLAKIENARVPRVYFHAFHDAIERAVIYDRVVVSILPEVRYPDMVAEVADFLLRLDEVEWACAIGTFDGNLHVSLRTTERDVNAGDLLRQVLGSDHAGGHDMTAGGHVPIGTAGPTVAAVAAASVRERLLAALGSSGASSRPLVG